MWRIKSLSTEQTLSMYLFGDRNSKLVMYSCAGEQLSKETKRGGGGGGLVLREEYKYWHIIALKDSVIPVYYCKWEKGRFVEEYYCRGQESDGAVFCS